MINTWSWCLWGVGRSRLGKFEAASKSDDFIIVLIRRPGIWQRSIYISIVWRKKIFVAKYSVPPIRFSVRNTAKQVPRRSNGWSERLSNDVDMTQDYGALLFMFYKVSANIYRQDVLSALVMNMILNSIAHIYMTRFNRRYTAQGRKEGRFAETVKTMQWREIVSSTNPFVLKPVHCWWNVNDTMSASYRSRVSLQRMTSFTEPLIRVGDAKICFTDYFNMKQTHVNFSLILY